MRKASRNCLRNKITRDRLSEMDGYLPAQSLLHLKKFEFALVVDLNGWYINI